MLAAPLEAFVVVAEVVALLVVVRAAVLVAAARVLGTDMDTDGERMEDEFKAAPVGRAALEYEDVTTVAFEAPDGATEEETEAEAEAEPPVYPGLLMPNCVDHW